MSETDSERYVRFLKMAADLRREAERAPDDVLASGYLELARVWLRLAEDHAPRSASNDEAAAEERSFKSR